MAGYVYIAGTLVLTVYGQMILKWRMNNLGSLPEGTLSKIKFLFFALTDPFVLSGFSSAFVAAMFWMAAMTKFEITKRIPL